MRDVGCDLKFEKYMTSNQSQDSKDVITSYLETHASMIVHMNAP